MNYEPWVVEAVAPGNTTLPLPLILTCWCYIYPKVDIRGQAQLVVATTPPGSPIRWDVGGIRGDRSGILHVQENQALRMRLADSSGFQPELLWGVNVYPKGDLKLPAELFIDGIKTIVAGSLTGADNVTIGNKGKLILRYENPISTDKL